MKISEILEELEDDRDATYVIGLIQMYKGPNAKIKDDLYESKSLASAMFTLPFLFLPNTLLLFEVVQHLYCCFRLEL